MNCKELGYKVGDKFEVLTPAGYTGFEAGAIIELTLDDESMMPRFKSGCNNEKWIYLSQVKKIETGKTLLEILVDELPKHGGWPEGVNFIAQEDNGGTWCFINEPIKDEDNEWMDGSPNGFYGRVGYLHKADDHVTAIITRDQYESALADKNEGWIKWDGGECPVEKGTLVDVKHRDGDLGFGQPAGMNGYADRGRATAEDWSHDDSGGDIIAYRLSKPEDVEQVDDSGVFSAGCSTDCSATIESLTDAIIEYGCEANLAYPLAKHLLSKGLFK